MFLYMVYLEHWFHSIMIQLIATSTVLFITLLHTLDASELHTKTNMTVSLDKVLQVNHNWREVECILGCKHYKGCSFTSFQMMNASNNTGLCSFYAAPNASNSSNVIQVAGYTSMLLTVCICLCLDFVLLF